MGKGDERALNDIQPQIYDELRRLAGYYMSGERWDHTLEPTALVHEAYLRLVDRRPVDWPNPAQFLGLAAAMMRRVLVNHARDRTAGKRGEAKVTLSLAPGIFNVAELTVLALDQALEKLAQLDESKLVLSN